MAVSNIHVLTYLMIDFKEWRVKVQMPETTCDAQILQSVVSLLEYVSNSEIAGYKFDQIAFIATLIAPMSGGALCCIV